MKEGSAATWASTFAKQALAKSPADFGSWGDFLTDFRTLFIHADVKNKVIAWLSTTIVKGNLQLRDYISQFKNNTVLSEINNDDADEPAHLVLVYTPLFSLFITFPPLQIPQPCDKLLQHPVQHLQACAIAHIASPCPCWPHYQSHHWPGFTY